MSFPARLWRVVRRDYRFDDRRKRDEDNKVGCTPYSEGLGFKTFALRRPDSNAALRKVQTAIANRGIAPAP
jgi:hypothetical protein